MKTILWSIFFLLPASISQAGQWVPMVQPPVIAQEQIVTTIVEPRVPQLVIKYQAVPHVVFETVHVEKRYMFRTITEVKMVPVTKWVYQPYYVIE